MKADKNKNLRMLKTAKGQVEGLIKMIEDDRYCIDINNQILATISILKKVSKDILHSHLSCCVMNAEDKQDRQQKLDEIMLLIDKLSK